MAFTVIIAVSLVSAGPSFAQPSSASSSLEIRSLRSPGIGGSGNQRLLNVSVEITNRGYVADNFTITLYWDGTIPVTTQSISNFAPGADQWFTLTALVAFDPTVGHYVAVDAGSAWVASPIYRPPGYGLASYPWWYDYTYLFIGLAIAMTLVTTVFVGRALLTKKANSLS